MVASVSIDFNSDKARATRSLCFSASEAVLAQAKELANEGRTFEALDLIDVFVNGRADPDNFVFSHDHLSVNDGKRAGKLVDKAVEITKTVQATILENAATVLANPKRMAQLIAEPNTARGIDVDTARTDGLIALSEDAFNRVILLRGAGVLNEYLATPLTEENVAEGLSRFNSTMALMKRASDTIGGLYVLKAVDLIDTGLWNATRTPRTDEQAWADWGPIQEAEAADAKADAERSAEPVARLPGAHL